MVLKKEVNYWRQNKADRAKLLVDGESYFSHFRSAILKAEKRILISGWDIDGQVKLIRSGINDGYPAELGEFLLAVLNHKKQLEIYILLWDFSMIYALERDWAPVLNHTNWRRHKRLHLFMDGYHKIGASHHQKIVTIDNALVFVGGMDLSKWRWDTPNHQIEDKNRVDPKGEKYPPHHDVQFMLSGPIVSDFNDLLHERWKNATGKPLPNINFNPEAEFFPAGEPDFENVNIAISRTYVTPQDENGITEIKQLHIDAIRSARKFIYIENQYLSSSLIADELQKSLQSESGPQIVIILPKKTGGWLEQYTMDVLRDRINFLLGKADKNDRLRIYYPQITSDDEKTLLIHSKVFIIDDTLLKVGSSNLSNRSMILDTECDILIDADNDSKIIKGIRAIRQRLLSEHLNITVDEFRACEQKKGDLIKTIETLSKGYPTLSILKCNMTEEQVEEVEKMKIVDPEKPVDPDQLIENFIGEPDKDISHRNIVKFSIMVAGLVLVALLWTFTPLGHLLNKETIVDWFRWQQGEIELYRQAVFFIVFIVLATIGLPVTILIGSAGILFGPFLGSALALGAATISSLVSYAIGHITGKKFIRNFSGDKINSISKRLSDRGIRAMVMVRIVPVASFSVINMLAGASHVKIKDYTIGTILGMIPGILLLTTFFGQLMEVIKNATLQNILIFSVTALILIVLVTSSILYLYKSNAQGHKNK